MHHPAEDYIGGWTGEFGASEGDAGCLYQEAVDVCAERVVRNGLSL
jgi:hypothetical protein